MLCGLPTGQRLLNEKIPNIFSNHSLEDFSMKSKFLLVFLLVFVFPLYSDGYKFWYHSRLDDCMVFNWFIYETDGSITMKKLRDLDGDGEQEIYTITNCRASIDKIDINNLLNTNANITGYYNDELMKVYSCPYTVWLAIEDDLKEYGVSLECFLVKDRIFWEED